LFIPGGLQHKTKCAVVCNWSADKNPNKNLIRINVYKRFSFCLSTSSSSFFHFLLFIKTIWKRKKGKNGSRADREAILLLLFQVLDSGAWSVPGYLLLLYKSRGGHHTWRNFKDGLDLMGSVRVGQPGNTMPTRQQQTTYADFFGCCWPPYWAASASTRTERMSIV
jgi:hypothetical protein